MKKLVFFCFAVFVSGCVVPDEIVELDGELMLVPTGESYVVVNEPPILEGCYVGTGFEEGRRVTITCISELGWRVEIAIPIPRRAKRRVNDEYGVEERFDLSRHVGYASGTATTQSYDCLGAFDAFRTEFDVPRSYSTKFRFDNDCLFGEINVILE